MNPVLAWEWCGHFGTVKFLDNERESCNIHWDKHTPPPLNRQEVEDLLLPLARQHRSFSKQMTDEFIISKLSSLLDECLASDNQGGSYKVRGIEDGKLVVEFDIVHVWEDGYIGFAGY